MDNEAGSLAGLASKARWALDCVWKRRWLALWVTLAIGLILGAAISMRPNRFEATARLYVDTQTVLKPLMAGITFQPDVDQQVQMLARTLISRPNVERLLRSDDFGFDVSEPAKLEKAIAALMAQIKVSPSGLGNLYEISYRGMSPELSQRLVESTVALFVTSGTDAKRRDSEEAGRFIDEQIRAYEAKLVEAENKVKEFKLRNFGVSGVSNQDHFARMSALSDEVNKLKTSLAAAEKARDAYRRELAGESPQLPVGAIPRIVPPEVAEVETRLEAQRRQLDDLLRRFTDQHPDVVSSRRTVAQLEAELVRRRDEAARGVSRGDNMQGSAATSPVFQKIRISLAETEAQVASLRAQLGTQQASLEQARAAAGRVPQVEAELAQLNRDYDVIRKNYELMVARRESASLGQKMDESSQMAAFRLVEPPQVKKNPVFPARLHLALAAVLLALGAGIMAALLAEIMRPTIDSPWALEEMTGRPTLGTISVLTTPRALAARRAAVLQFATAAAAILILQAGWVAWIASGSSIVR